THRRDMVPREAAAGEDPLAVGHRGRDALRRRALDLPRLLAGQRLEAGDLVAAGHQQLIAAIDLQDDRRGVVGRLGTVLFPDLLAGRPIQAGDQAAALVVGRHDHQRTIHRRRGAETLVQDVITYFRLPQLLALETQGGGVDGVLVEEVDEDSPAVTRGRRGGVRTLVVAALDEAALVDRRLPQLLARLRGGAQQRLRPALLL